MITRPGAAVVAGMAVALTLPLWLGRFWLFTVSQSLVMAVAVLSVVVLARATGAVSLCQASFMGVGAYATAWLYSEVGLAFGLAALIGAAVAAPVGAAVAFPALRLRGPELAVLTLAVGLAANAVVFSPQAPLRVSGVGASLSPVPAPAGVDLGDPVAQYFVLLGVAVATFAAAAVLLRGRVGATWRAARAGSAAAAASGIRTTRWRILGFAVASAIAGIAGVMLVTLQNTVTAQAFGTGPSVALVVVATLGGLERLGAAVVGGAVLGIGQQLLPTFDLQGNWLTIVVGAAVVVAIVARERRAVSTAGA